MPRWFRVDLTQQPQSVVNVEVWEETPPETDGVLYHQQEGAAINWIWDGSALNAPEPPPLPVPDVISDRQFAQALAKMGVIDKDEALAFVKRGEVPATLQAVVDAISDPDERFDVDMAVSGATTFERSNPSTLVLAAALKWSPEQMDDLWRSAASIR